MNFKLLFLISCIGVLAACNPSKQIAKSAQRNVLEDSSLRTAHVGISIYEPATGKYWYNYQGDKYFVPASNTKLATCYAAMKYLGDSLVGLDVLESEDNIFLRATGDPTFLHEDFKVHPVYNFINSLKNSKKIIWFGSGGFFMDNPWGFGWSWSDYDADYMAERSAFPIYGNVISFSGKRDSLKVIPQFFKNEVEKLSIPNGFLNRISRSLTSNTFQAYFYSNTPRTIQTPFITSISLSYQLLKDTLTNKFNIVEPGSPPPVIIGPETFKNYFIHSQPTDSLLKPMMHRSDNFFAEQTLLMVSRTRLKIMNDEKIIDTLLKTDFKDLPQKPNWVDGCGLSRYDLFTPQDFVAILNKIKNEFGMDRIKNILATGGEGTISSYYKADKGYIFAKTGTLSGVVALSGYLYTKKNKLLIFSVLVNNHQSSATAVRRAVERFMQGIRNHY